MFLKAVSSMSYPVFLDLVVTDRVLSLTSYLEIDESQFVANQDPSDDQSEPIRSLQFEGSFVPGQLPPTATGVYHNRLPCVRLEKPLLKGEELAARLGGRFFKAVSYSLLDLDDPSIRNGEKSDGAVWVCGVDYQGNMRPFYNAVAFETATKMHPMRSVRNLGTPSNLFIYQPFADMPLTECSMTLKYNLSLGYRSNVDGFIEASDYNYLTDLDLAFPTMEMVSGGGMVEPDGYTEVTVRLASAEGKDTTLYLEETGGYLPMKRVQTVGGVATFKVGALGLQTGDAFKVKVGLRNFSGMLDVPFEVAA
jgi:hypothetical protein